MSNRTTTLPCVVKPSVYPTLHIQDSNSMVIVIVQISMNFVNALLHGLGIHLLFSLKKFGRSEQSIYILNLSLTELLMNVGEIIRKIIEISGTLVTSSSMTHFFNFVSILMYTGISFVFYVVMIYITLDRLLHIALNVRYKLYWNPGRAKRLLAITWAVGLTVSGSVMLAQKFNNFDWEHFFYKYFYPIMGFVFVLIAMVTYAFIFHRYKISRRHLLSQRRKKISRGDKKGESAFKIFRRSRFFIPVLLILTFIVFMVVPDLVYLFVIVIGKKYSKDSKEYSVLQTSIWVSYAVSNAVDACIYIFMQKSIRRLLVVKCRRLCRRYETGESYDLSNHRPSATPSTSYVANSNFRRQISDFDTCQTAIEQASMRSRLKSDASPKSGRYLTVDPSLLYQRTGIDNACGNGVPCKVSDSTV